MLGDDYDCISWFSLSTEADAARKQGFAHVIWMGQVQHSIADQHHQLSMLSKIRAGKRAIVSLDDHAFPHPLPELFLGGPEFFAIAANNQRSFLLFGLLRLLG